MNKDYIKFDNVYYVSDENNIITKRMEVSPKVFELENKIQIIQNKINRLIEEGEKIQEERLNFIKNDSLFFFTLFCALYFLIAGTVVFMPVVITLTAGSVITNIAAYLFGEKRISNILEKIEKYEILRIKYERELEKEKNYDSELEDKNTDNIEYFSFKNQIKESNEYIDESIHKNKILVRKR